MSCTTQHLIGIVLFGATIAAVGAGGDATWFRRFEGSPSSGTTIEALDGLRACAVIMVFVRHSWGLSGAPSISLPLGFVDVGLAPFIMLSSSGVDLFFVLSGFLLSRPFLHADLVGAPAPDLRRYARSRAWRILPGYWFAFAVLVLIFLPALVDSSQLVSVNGLLSILAHGAVFQLFFTFSYGLWGPASPYWTLSLEVMFYAVLPWAVRLFKRGRGLIGLALAIATTFAWLIFVRGAFPGAIEWISDHSRRDGSSPAFVRFWLSKQLPAYAFSFSAGISVAAITVRNLSTGPHQRVTESQRRLVSVLSLVAGILVLVLSMRWLGTLSIVHSYFDGLVLMDSQTATARLFYYLEGPLMATGFGLVLLGVVTGATERWTAPLRWRWMRLIGILGFGIYLWHMPLLYLYVRQPVIIESEPLRRWFLLSVSAGLSAVGASIFSYLAVEQPMLRRGRRAQAVRT